MGAGRVEMAKFRFVCLIIFFGRTAWVCTIFLPQPSMEPAPPAIEVGSLNLWTTGKFLSMGFEGGEY